MGRFIYNALSVLYNENINNMWKGEFLVMKRKTSILWKTSIFRKMLILLSAGIFGMQITGCAAVTDELIYGTETVLQGSDGYREFTGEDVHSPLIVFPDKEIESISEEFYYEFR